MRPDDDVDLAVRSLFALSVQLGDKPYLMGDTPCGTDATAFGALSGILTPFFTSPLRERTAQFQNLTEYVDRMMLQYYPEFAWTAQRQAADAPRSSREEVSANRADASAQRFQRGTASPFSAASSVSSSAIRASRAASAAATSAASNFCGICCGQLVSQAAILNRITCSGRAL